MCGVETLNDSLAAADVGLTLDVFPSGQLGGEQEMIQSVEIGDLDITTGGPSALANWYAPWGVLDGAYALDDWEHAQRVWQSEIGDDLRDGIAESGNMHTISYWLYGTRHITANVRVSGPQDLSGVKMRAIDTPESLANMRALGGEPVPVAFAELYVGLQQGVVSGQENPLPTIETLRLYEVQDYLALTGHLVQTVGVVLNLDTWQALSEGQQGALTEAFAAASDAVADCTEDSESELLSSWEESGVFAEIVTPSESEIDEFRENARAELAQFEDRWGAGRYDRVRELS